MDPAITSTPIFVTCTVAMLTILLDTATKSWLNSIPSGVACSPSLLCTTLAATSAPLPLSLLLSTAADTGTAGSTACPLTAATVINTPAGGKCFFKVQTKVVFRTKLQKFVFLNQWCKKYFETVLK